MATLCDNAACREPLSAKNSSRDSPGYCLDCGGLVFAFRPDRERPEDWYLVSDPGIYPFPAAPVTGSVVSGGQCETCSLNEFQVVQVSRRTWEASCVGQVADGSTVEGCGARHPIRMKARCLVIHPWSGEAEA